jgi:hypothetical protein
VRDSRIMSPHVERPIQYRSYLDEDNKYNSKQKVITRSYPVMARYEITKPIKTPVGGEINARFGNVDKERTENRE